MNVVGRRWRRNTMTKKQNQKQNIETLLRRFEVLERQVEDLRQIQFFVDHVVNQVAHVREMLDKVIVNKDDINDKM